MLLCPSLLADATPHTSQLVLTAMQSSSAISLSELTKLLLKGREGRPGSCGEAACKRGPNWRDAGTTASFLSVPNHA